jgi:hypothetical protein
MTTDLRRQLRAAMKSETDVAVLMHMDLLNVNLRRLERDQNSEALKYYIGRNMAGLETARLRAAFRSV